MLQDSVLQEQGQMHATAAPQPHHLHKLLCFLHLRGAVSRCSTTSQAHAMRKDKAHGQVQQKRHERNSAPTPSYSPCSPRQQTGCRRRLPNAYHHALAVCTWKQDQLVDKRPVTAEAPPAHRLCCQTEHTCAALCGAVLCQAAGASCTLLKVNIS